MRYRKLDALGDYTLGSGRDFYIDEPNVVAQAVLTRLRLWLEEWFLDTTDGTPYKEEVLGKWNGRNPGAAIQSRILGTPGVTGITSFSTLFDGDSRKLTVNASVDTVFGPITIAEVL